MGKKIDKKNVETMDKNVDNSEHDTSEKSKKGSVLRKAAGPLVGVAVLIVAMGIVHVTNLKYELRSDPMAKAVEFVRVFTASNVVEKANVHLAMSEDKLREFKKLKAKNSPNPEHLSLVANDIIKHNRSAITYMDQAKNEGQDIKELKLVKRLCDTLGEQAHEIGEVNNTIVGLHDFAEKLEGRVEDGEDLRTAMEAVEKDLSEAMKW